MSTSCAPHFSDLFLFVMRETLIVFHVFFSLTILKPMLNFQDKEESEDQESIQSSTTPDLSHYIIWENDKNTVNITQKRAKR